MQHRARPPTSVHTYCERTTLQTSPDSTNLSCKARQDQQSLFTAHDDDGTSGFSVKALWLVLVVRVVRQ